MHLAKCHKCASSLSNFATDLDAQLIQRNWGMSKKSAHLKGCQGSLTVSYSAFLFTSPPPFPLAFLITC